jgi:hypothetical protein
MPLSQVAAIESTAQPWDEVAVIEKQEEERRETGGQLPRRPHENWNEFHSLFSWCPSPTAKDAPSETVVTRDGPSRRTR